MMTAKNKKEFFEKLEQELYRIGVDDFEEIRADFEDHFEQSAEQGLSEEDTCKNLGDISEIARGYLNLESSRINSIIARDLENSGRRVSLTKQGHSVPADLNLIKEKEEKEEEIREAQNSDCVREYTPEHFSEEIYPDSRREAPDFDYDFSKRAANDNDPDNPDNSNNVDNDNQNTDKNDNNAENNSENSSGAGANQNNVAAAFGAAGKAVADAAKVTGQAIAGAFGQGEVKQAVKNAGKSTADAMKTAGRSAADAVKKAKTDHDEKKQASTIPNETQDYRKNINNDRKAEMPKSSAADEKEYGGVKFSAVKDLEPNINAGKLITAILLDVFLWSWLLPLIASAIIGLFGGGAGIMIFNGFGAFANAGFFFISRVFLCVGFSALGAIIMLIAACLVKPLIKLVHYIIELHLKAVYDL